MKISIQVKAWLKTENVVVSFQSRGIVNPVKSNCMEQMAMVTELC